MSRSDLNRAARRSRPRIELLEGRQLLAAFTVTTVNDTGAGSLRQAIVDANATPEPSTIGFDIGSGGIKSILPATPLPALANSITIDGTTQPGYAGTPIIQLNGSQVSDPLTKSTLADGLLIKAGNCTIKGLDINLFNGSGIHIDGGGRNTITGNFLGTDLSGQISFPNSGDGIFIVNSRNNQIGGTSLADRNVISGNGGGGIDILASTNSVTGSNIVEGNFIGTDVSGQLPLGNTFDGVTINSSAGNIVGGTAQGTANTIAFNGGDGVKVLNYYAFGGQQLVNTILSNSITGNGNLGIDLLYGSTSPVYNASLDSVYTLNGNTVIEGSFAASPSSSVTLQFFTNLVSNFSGAGEGRTLIGTATASANDRGVGQFTVTLPGTIDPGTIVTATATNSALGTSAFFYNAIAATNPSADLAVTQDASSSTNYAGDTLTYYLTVSNKGPSRAHGVTLTDTLPGDVRVVSVDVKSAVVSQANGVITVAIGDMDRGQVVGVTIEVVPTLAGSLTNVATVSGSLNDSTVDNNTSKVVTEITPNPNPPVVLEVRPVVGLRSINAVIVRFNVPLDPAQAVNPINYRIVAADRHRLFTRSIALKAPVYDPERGTVTLTPKHPLQLGTLYRVEIDGQGAAGVTDLSGNLLSGNTAAGPEGPYYLQFSRGYVSPLANGGGRRGAVKLVQSVTRRQAYNGPAASIPSNLY